MAGAIACGVILSAAGALHTWRSCRGGTRALPERTVDVIYGFTVREIPADAKDIVVWVPVPPSSKRQLLEAFHIEEGWPHVILVEPEYGNRFPCLDLSGGVSQDRDDLDVAVTFRVGRKSCRVLDGVGEAESPSPTALARFLVPDGLIPTDGRIAEEASRVAGGARGPLARARPLYDHVVSTVAYDKSDRMCCPADSTRTGLSSPSGGISRFRGPQPAPSTTSSILTWR